MACRSSHLGALLSALSLFTRLPFWRLRELTKTDYEAALNWWPVAGLLTGGVLAGSFYLLQLLLPLEVALLGALAGRMLLTGAFHEDGLGDFFDGFGGGRSREQVLTIMKDSHVGSYAVLGLLLYFLLYWRSASALPAEVLPWILLASDLTGKSVSLLQVQCLPYARREETSKLGLIYRRLTPLPALLALLLPLATQAWALLALGLSGYRCLLPSLLALTLGLLLTGYLKRRIAGYTGDTCGALCLLCELASLVGFLASYQLAALA